MPTSQGKIYFGASLVAQPGEPWDYTLAYPPDAGTDATYTIPGTLQQTFTTSGTYTPAPGVSTVHVAVIGGGAPGGASPGRVRGGGGSGGAVRVFRNVPVSGPVAVTIGGSNTASSFGALTAPTGNPGGTPYPGRSPNMAASAGGVGNVIDSNTSQLVGATGGQAGVMINGTYYAGGGGGVGWTNYGASHGPGGAGGGGVGGTGAGAAGTGGGGGGGWDTGSGYPGRPGGSGRVMIWTEDI